MYNRIRTLTLIWSALPMRIGCPPHISRDKSIWNYSRLEKLNKPSTFRRISQKYKFCLFIERFV